MSVVEEQLHHLRINDNHKAYLDREQFASILSLITVDAQWIQILVQAKKTGTENLNFKDRCRLGKARVYDQEEVVPINEASAFEIRSWHGSVTCLQDLQSIIWTQLTGVTNYDPDVKPCRVSA